MPNRATALPKLLVAMMCLGLLPLPGQAKISSLQEAKVCIERGVRVREAVEFLESVADRWPEPTPIAWLVRGYWDIVTYQYGGTHFDYPQLFARVGNYDTTGQDAHTLPAAKREERKAWLKKILGRAKRGLDTATDANDPDGRARRALEKYRYLALVELACWHLEAGQLHEAVSYAREAAERKPRVVDTAKLIRKIAAALLTLWKSGHPGSSLRDRAQKLKANLDQVLQLCKEAWDEPGDDFYRAEARRELQTARAYLNEIGEEPPPPPPLLDKIVTAFQHGEYDAAVELCRQWIRKEPQAPEPYLWMGRCYAARRAAAPSGEKFRWFEKAVGQFRQALRLVDAKIGQVPKEDADEQSRLEQYRALRSQIATCLGIELIYGAVEEYKRKRREADEILRWLTEAYDLGCRASSSYWIAMVLLDKAQRAGEGQKAALRTEAMRYLNETISVGGYPFAGRDWLAQLYLEQRQYEKAIELLEYLAWRRPDARVCYLLATAFYNAACCSRRGDGERVSGPSAEETLEKQALLYLNALFWLERAIEEGRRATGAGERTWVERAQTLLRYLQPDSSNVLCIGIVAPGSRREFADFARRLLRSIPGRYGSDRILGGSVHTGAGEQQAALSGGFAQALLLRCRWLAVVILSPMTSERAAGSGAAQSPIQAVVKVYNAHPNLDKPPRRLPMPKAPIARRFSMAPSNLPGSNSLTRQQAFRREAAQVLRKAILSLIHGAQGRQGGS